MDKIISLTDRLFGRYALIFRYLVSGAVSFGTNIVLLYILGEFLKLNYLPASVISFIVAFIVSFLMMKNVTFRDGNSERMHRQMAAYFAVAIFNLGLNSLFVFLFVEKMNIWYIFSQVASSLIIAVWSFFIYKYFIFT